VLSHIPKAITLPSSQSYTYEATVVPYSGEGGSERQRQGASVHTLPEPVFGDTYMYALWSAVTAEV